MKKPVTKSVAKSTASKVTTPTATIEEGALVIRMPMQAPTPSGSGKSLVIATTHGIMATTLVFQGKPVSIGVNAFIKA